MFIATAIAGNQYTPIDILKRYIRWAWFGAGGSIPKIAYQNKKSRYK